jgi:hypothetical protein
MNDELERILSEALDLLEQGVGVEAIVARYPAHAAELRPFLLTATQLARLATQPSLTAEQRSKRAFLAAAAAPRAGRAPVGGRLARLFAPALAVLLIFLLGSAALVGASASAVPGSALYETKRLVESLRLGLATDPERAAVLRERFRQERLAEVEQLLTEDRTADVTFVGTVAAIDGPRWTVDGLPVNVAEAVVDGTPRVGALVEITGRVVAGMVRAAQVAVLSGGLPEATPTPPPTPPATEANDDAGAAEAATVTPTPTATITPRPSATPTATTTAPATSTTAATVTATAPAAPSATPGDDNSNDNDDNDNQAPTPPPPSATPGDDNSNDNDDNSNDNDDNSNDNDDNDNQAPTPPSDPSPTPADDNGNDNDDNGNDNDDNDNGNDNDDDGGSDNDNDDNSGSGGDDNDNDNGD